MKVRRSLTGGMGNDPAPTAAAPSASPVATQASARSLPLGDEAPPFQRQQM